MSVALFRLWCARRFLVTFRMVVFRPARSEVIVGKVKSSTEDGIRGECIFAFGCE